MNNCPPYTYNNYDLRLHVHDKHGVSEVDAMTNLVMRNGHDGGVYKPDYIRAARDLAYQWQRDGRLIYDPEKKLQSYQWRPSIGAEFGAYDDDTGAITWGIFHLRNTADGMSMPETRRKELNPRLVATLTEAGAS